jgi:Tol biopolymer transport system component/tRNA A-37 threonylcarbamoyl transferase component Bud32
LSNANCPDSDTLNELACGALEGLAAQSPVDEPGTLLRPGERFAGYVIVELLGAGAMGLVYAARDEELQRPVALKLVRPSKTAGLDEAPARERLLREAKAAAALSHPNVVVVHEVGTFGGQVFIAMELVDGSLTDWLAAAPRATSEIVAMLVNAGKGLAAAHDAGLVHRDFKPDNVLVGRDGRPRVADFGVVRRVSEPGVSNPPTISGGSFAGTLSLTQTGALVGTPAYVSPEQWRGEVADARSDQFAFAVSLYECVYGARPTGRQDVSSIDRRRTPRIPRTAPGGRVAASVRHALARAMSTNPSDRFPDMHALLRAIGDDDRASRWATRAAPIVAAIVAAGAGTIASATWLGRASALARSPPTAGAASGNRFVPLVPTHPRRITFEDGCEEYPAFTPDSRSIVFDATRGSDSVLVVKSLEDGAERQLTHVRGWDMAARVSPDGGTVAFQRYVEGDASAWIVDFEGTQQPRLLGRGWVPPSYAPDGTAVWYGDSRRLKRVEIATGQVTREIPRSPWSKSPHVREVPDGRVAVLYPGDRGQMTGVALYALDGSLRWLTADPSTSRGTVGRLWRDELERAVALDPGGGYVLVSRDTEAGNPELFALLLSGGEPLRIEETDVAVRRGLDLSPDGKRIVWSTCHAEQTPVRITRDSHVVPLREVQPWFESAAVAVPGSRRLVVISERDGTMSPWVIDQDGKDVPRKLSVPGYPVQVAVSPDGQLVAVQLGSAGIALVPANGGPVRRLTENAGDSEPCFARDGTTVLFTRQLEVDGTQVFSIPAAGGEPRPLLEPGSSHAAVSTTDGRIAYLAGSGSDELTPYVYDTRAGARRRLSPGLRPGTYRAVVFSADGKHVAVLLGFSHVFEVDVSTGAVLRSVDSETDSFWGLSYVGNDPVVIRSVWLGDLWLAETRP